MTTFAAAKPNQVNCISYWINRVSRIDSFSNMVCIALLTSFLWYFSTGLYFYILFVDLLVHFTICSSDYISIEGVCVCILRIIFPILSILISFYCYYNSSESFPSSFNKQTNKTVENRLAEISAKWKKNQIEIDPLITNMQHDPYTQEVKKQRFLRNKKSLSLFHRNTCSFIDYASVKRLPRPQQKASKYVQTIKKKLEHNNIEEIGRSNNHFKHYAYIWGSVLIFWIIHLHSIRFVYFGTT